MKSRGPLGNMCMTYILINWKNLKEMDNFLDAFDPLKLNQEDINHLHRSITSNEIEAIKSPSTKSKEGRKENKNSILKTISDSELKALRGCHQFHAYSFHFSLSLETIEFQKPFYFGYFITVI
jgi:hypothetical protein